MPRWGLNTHIPMHPYTLVHPIHMETCIDMDMHPHTPVHPIHMGTCIDIHTYLEKKKKINMEDSSR